MLLIGSIKINTMENTLSILKETIDNLQYDINLNSNDLQAEIKLMEIEIQHLEAQAVAQQIQAAG